MQVRVLHCTANSVFVCKTSEHVKSASVLSEIKNFVLFTALSCRTSVGWKLVALVPVVLSSNSFVQVHNTSNIAR